MTKERINFKRRINEAWMPSFLVQKDFWEDDTYIPIIRPNQQCNTKEIVGSPYTTSGSTSNNHHAFSNYLNRNLLPSGVKVEGKEEIPCVEPYTIDLPMDICGMDERVPQNASKYGMHGFCYDYVLVQKLHNINRVVQKAKHFHCVLAPNFSVPMDGFRCEAIEAIRYNRVATIYLQQNGIPTIQTVSLTSVKFFDIAYDGLAPNCPIAFENMCVKNDPQQKYLFRLAVDKLIELKSPTVLVVVGNHLDFDPQIPVVYYESRIQKLRRHGYNKKVRLPRSLH